MATLDFILRRRDPRTGEPLEQTQTCDPSRTAIVIVDAWASHWCKTWEGLAGGRIPRLNEALKVARQLGFTIIHAPTDTVSAFAGWPQRERIAALPRMAMPQSKVELPPFPAAPHERHCMCAGLSCCLPHYGHQGIDPRLEIADTDLISADGVEVYTWLKTHGLTHLIHMGFATNMCMTGKPEGMTAMMAAGLDCVFCRDLTEAWGWGRSAVEADWVTRACIEHLEKYAPSIDFTHTLDTHGLWPRKPIDTVRVVPWGSSHRPGYFRDRLDLTMSFLSDGQIRYTLDESEPTAESPRYEGAITLKQTTRVRAQAFVDGRPVGLDADCRYVLLPPAPPPPDVHLSDLSPVQVTMSAYLPWYAYNAVPPPQKDRSYTGSPLTLRGQSYPRGMGVQAPGHLVYAIEPNYARFVAVVGMDEALMQHDLGRDSASCPSAEFRVFIDGRLAAASPVMRLGEEPWAFDVPIPPGSKTISLAVTDAGDGNREDRANWVNAGFVLRT